MAVLLRLAVLPSITLLLILQDSLGQDSTRPPIIYCHLNRSVTVDISFNSSVWKYVAVDTDPDNPICKSKSPKAGLIFDIDRECKLTKSVNSTHKIITFNITALKTFPTSIQVETPSVFTTECTTPHDPGRTAPLFNEGKYKIEPNSEVALSTTATRTLIIIVGCALLILFALIFGIACVTCDCFGKRRRRGTRSRKY
jgi:hypothetical protein